MKTPSKIGNLVTFLTSKKIKIILMVAFIFVITIFYVYLFYRGKPTYYNNGNDSYQNNINYPANDSIDPVSPDRWNPNSGNRSRDNPDSGMGGANSLMSSSSGKDYYDSIGKELPSDLDTVPCGSYAGEYSICSGTCSSGQCISEERSCYCRL